MTTARAFRPGPAAAILGLALGIGSCAHLPAAGATPESLDVSADLKEIRDNLRALE